MASNIRGVDLLIVFALSLVSVPLLALILIAQPIGLKLTDTVHLGLMLSHYVTSLIAVHVVIVRGRAVTWSDVGFRSASRRWFVLAILLPICGILLVATLEQTLDMPAVGANDIGLSGMCASGAAMLGFLVILGTIAPISEEILFRGLLYGWLRIRFGVGRGVALSALAFYFAHIWSLEPVHLVMGAILALLYDKSGSLWPPIVSHGTFNLAAIFALYVSAPHSVAVTRF